MSLLKTASTLLVALILGPATTSASPRQSIGPVSSSGRAVRPNDFRRGDIYFLDNAYPSTAPGSVIRKLDDHKFTVPGAAHSTFFTNNPGGNLSVLEYDAYRKSLIIQGSLGGGAFPGTYAIDVDGNVSQFINWGTNTADLASNGEGLIYLLAGRIYYLDAADVPHSLLDARNSPPTHFFFEVPNPCNQVSPPCNPPLTSVSKLYYQRRTNSLFALATVSTSGCSTQNVIVQAMLNAAGTEVIDVRDPYYLTDPCAVAFTLTAGPAGLPLGMSRLNGALWADKVTPAPHLVSNYYLGILGGPPNGTVYSSCAAYSDSAGGAYFMGQAGSFPFVYRNIVYYSPGTGPIEVLSTPMTGTDSFASAAAGEMIVIP